MDTAEHTARVIHEAIRAYNVTVGAPALPSWDALQGSIRQLDIRFVGVMRALRVPTSAKVMHEWWMSVYGRGGWTPGDQYHAGRQITPRLVPWDRLSGTDIRRVLITWSLLGVAGYLAAAEESRGDEVVGSES